MQIFEVTATVTVERSFYVEAGHRDEAEAAAERMAEYAVRCPQTDERGSVRGTEAQELSKWDRDTSLRVYKAREALEAHDTHNMDHYLDGNW